MDGIHVDGMKIVITGVIMPPNVMAAARAQVSASEKTKTQHKQ
ncbi:hypothetical protein [Endozoicomonas sp. GU-1]|nr:hypothetical protein [Endozoicomonas sp. GU-1]WBA83549.1 hypothetical protein O2T12_10685 [Endozoicomonas sp. GU-1]WBA86481.1 hypothetical protein O3276_00020 [Endozoicomonas sp. GU-1]